MKVLLFAAFALVVLQAAFADKDDCEKGEEYKTGVSSTCAEYKCGECEDPNRPCTTDYVSGCFCKDNFYRRQSDNKCVPKNQC